MTARQIYFRGNRGDVRDIARQMADVLMGREADSFGIRRGFLLALGFGALSDVKAAFLVKTRGGTDEMGIKWEPLKPATIANRRVGQNDTAVKRALKERDKAVKREAAWLLQIYRLTLDEGTAQARARRVAEARVSRQPGMSKFAILANRQVDILRDNDILFNSIGPGTIGGDFGSYSKPSGPGGSDQVFDLTRNGIIVGTNVDYAGTHQNGYRPKNVPARPFLPPTEAHIPDIWWQRWLGISIKAFESGAAKFMAGGAK